MRTSVFCANDLKPRPWEPGNPPSVCRGTLAVPISDLAIVIFLRDGSSPIGFVYDVRQSTVTAARFLAISSTKIEFQGNRFSLLTEDLAASPRLGVWRNFRYGNGRLTSTVDRQRTFNSFPVKGVFASQAEFDRDFGYDPEAAPQDVEDSKGDYRTYNYDFSLTEDGRACVTPQKTPAGTTLCQRE